MQSVTSPLRNVTGVLLLILAIGCLTCGLILGKYVIGSTWWLWCTGVFSGICLSLPLRGMWRWLTGRKNVAVTIILNCLLLTPLTCSSVLILNYAYPSAENKEKATVTRLYTETRHHTRRVSRKHYAQGAPYKVYFMEIDLPRKGSKSIECTHKAFKTLMKGDTVTLTVGKGLFGISYVDPKSIEYPNNVTPERKKESLRELRHRKYREHINKIRKKHD